MTPIILVLLLATTSYGLATPVRHHRRTLAPPYNVIYNSDFYRYDPSVKNPTDASEEEDCTLEAIPPKPQTMCCGFDSTTQNLIYGGNETQLGQYPWLAAIEFYNKDTKRKTHECGGSLISGRYVLSAGHCFINSNYMPIAVYLGDHYLYYKGRDCANAKGVKKCTDGHQRIPIPPNGVIRPPYFYKKTNSYNDIALIRLSKTARFTDYIRPICLPDFDIKKETENTTLLVAGWGLTEKNPTNVTALNNIKKHVALPLRNKEACDIFSRKWTRNSVCAGGQKGKDSCTGDSGGPLMLNRRGQYFLVGVISVGKGCGLELPAVYTDVYKYMKWIKDNIY